MVFLSVISFWPDVTVQKNLQERRTPRNDSMKRAFFLADTVAAGTAANRFGPRIRTYGGDVLMRYIRGSFFALTSVLILLSSAQAQSVSIGQTSVLSGGDSGNGNLLLAQSATLAQAATVQSLVLLRHRRQWKADPRHL